MSLLHDYVIKAFCMFLLRLSFHHHLTPVDHLRPSLETNRLETADNISFHRSQLICLCSERWGNGQSEVRCWKPNRIISTVGSGAKFVFGDTWLPQRQGMRDKHDDEFPRFPPQICFVAPFSVINFLSGPQDGEFLIDLSAAATDVTDHQQLHIGQVRGNVCWTYRNDREQLRRNLTQDSADSDSDFAVLNGSFLSCSLR